MRRITDRETYRATAENADRATRIPVELRLSDVDPFTAYRRARTDEWGVCLETTGEQSGWGYFAVTPSVRLTVGPNGLRCGADGKPTDASHGDFADGSATLAALEQLIADTDLQRGPCDVPYPGGVFGWLSYDVARELESLPGETRDDRGLPRLQAARYETLAAWESDDPTTLRVCAAPRLDAGQTDESLDVDAAYDHAVSLAESLAERATTGDPSVGDPPSDADRVQFTSDTGKRAYADRVRAVREYVRAGDTFQANVSHRLRAPAAVHPVETYAALREVNPAPYSGLIEFRDADLVSASPELLVRREPTGNSTRLETEPIAGTRPRGETDAADAALETELTSDEKERAEHAMLVDLERNDLGKVSQPGSVSVAEYRRVDRYASVMHLVSRVVGQERSDRSLADTLAAMFPGGTITGAPKPRTMAIIDELEATRRGPYTGSLFALGFDGRLVANILIRTLVQTDDEYHLRVGAGIVHDSVPSQEYEETLDKARGLVSALATKTDGAPLGVGDRSARDTSADQQRDTSVDRGESVSPGGDSA